MAWLYLVAVALVLVLVLVVAYVLFMRKYYHLYEECLGSGKRNGCIDREQMD